MPTFRFYTGSLSESLKTSVMVNNIQELSDSIMSYYKNDPFLNGEVCDPKDLIITPYVFDERIGWNTHLVVKKAENREIDDYVVGFLSDNFE